MLGVDYIQFDEPAFNVFFDEVKDWGIKILEKAASNLKSKNNCTYLLWLWN